MALVPLQSLAWRFRFDDGQVRVVAVECSCPRFAAVCRGWGFEGWPLLSCAGVWLCTTHLGVVGRASRGWRTGWRFFVARKPLMDSCHC